MIVVVDYGMGNLRSVSKALEHLGGKVKVSASPRDVEVADKLVLPGVGAFGDAVRELQYAKLFEPVQSFLQAKKPFLGICLGLQLLFEQSDENPDISGLGILEGKVRAFESPGIKIPHMGWNQIRITNEHRLLRGVPDESNFYFVHSYYAVPKDTNLIAARCLYGEEDFAACLGSDTFFATQFHPEKSQEAGLMILRNFLAW